MKIAILDDYQQVALTTADWLNIQAQASVTVFTDHLADADAVVERLQPFSIICVMRERTPLTRAILSALPKLKLIVSTGSRNASIDVAACEDLHIELKHTRYVESGAPELTWAMLMAAARHIVTENNNFKSGKWQSTIGIDLKGKTIGIVGMGRIGKKMAAYAKAFDMNIIAWSQNLTAEAAAEAGAQLVSKEDIFRQSDFVTVHLVLSDRSRGIIDAASLSLMKPTAMLINTSRGPLIDEDALIKTLQNKRIACAVLDVFNTEPLPVDHILRQLDNVLATPHIGYVTQETYSVFYTDTVKIIEEWLGNK